MSDTKSELEVVLERELAGLLKERAIIIERAKRMKDKKKAEQMVSDIQGLIELKKDDLRLAEKSRLSEEYEPDMSLDLGGGRKTYGNW